MREMQVGSFMACYFIPTYFITFVTLPAEYFNDQATLIKYKKYVHRKEILLKKLKLIELIIKT